jgi:hypothetical protein
VSSSSSSEIPAQYQGPTTTTTTTTSSSSSSEIPAQYLGPTTTATATTTSSPVSSSTSSQVPDQYGQTTTSSLTSSSSSSVEVPDQYGQTTTTTSSSSSSSVEILDQYPQTTTTSSSSSSSSIQIPDQYAQTTTTTTTSSSSSSAAAAFSTIPYSAYLVLPSPTPCDYGDPPDYDEDDSYCELDLPFSIQLYGTSSPRTFASSNGYIGLNRGSSQFQVNQFPYSAIPENTIAPFFDDLELYGKKNPRQGLYYQIDGGKVTFEWYVGRSGQTDADKARLSQSIYHFTMAYDSAVPNTFVYTYYAVGSSAMQDAGVNGAYAAVGIQGRKLSIP